MSSSLRRILAGLAWLAAMSVAGAQTVTTSVKFARLEDYDTGTVLFDKAGEAPMAPASTSKLMVAEIVFHELKEGRLTLDNKEHVSEYAWRTGGAHAHGSAMFLAVKSDVRVEDLLRGLLVQSGNDAAIVLAEGLGGSEESFVALMNTRAAELGLTHSHFTNSWGRSDADELVTAQDMAALARHLIRDYPEYYHYFAEKEFTWNKIRQLNRNPLLTLDIGADGLKTGDTSESGFGLVGSAVQGGQRLIVVVNGAKSAPERAEEARKLLNWGFRSFDVQTFFAPGDVVGSADVYGGLAASVDLTPATPVKTFVPRAGGEKLTARIVYQGPLAAPVAEGASVAELRIYQGETEMLRAPLRTRTAVARGTLVSRASDAAQELAKSLLRRAWKRP